ncbi:MAG: 16S rRNA (guanine(527)-N(7))-methyltransferase RsmG [Sphingomonadales bacterium]
MSTLSPNGTAGVALIEKYFDEFTKLQRQRYEQLGPLYGEWNEKINVISRKDIDALYEKHVLHSLSIAANFPFAKGTSILDLGTGGGFPGLPLAIYFPDVQFHLVDSIAKKLKVVQAVADVLGLQNLTVQHTRAEDIKQRQFDYVISRAVAPLGDLWRWSKHLIRTRSAVAGNSAPTGLICLKGGDLALEIQQSGTRPHVVDIHTMFAEEFFREKYLLFVER